MWHTASPLGHSRKAAPVRCFIYHSKKTPPHARLVVAPPHFCVSIQLELGPMAEYGRGGHGSHISWAYLPLTLKAVYFMLINHIGVTGANVADNGIVGPWPYTLAT